ncbi:nuclear transport factor 2 family protein [Isoptericola sp. NEAU-Y5]|uniref:Nuclear transport factor 2 family protein n=1 Tax=Isoptericola luteus TaxID=2879484 RepID=A0ABS7ZHD0_9MICO|nr:nuclear transport factor 2 family protein [Isoptericola sp. NEAU-Y5]MCA5894430.1 nuclear transport factor 2 family protein [Isoptericola sp. NEAU-Y5]
MTTLTLDRLLGLEHAGWAALCESRGGTFYGDLMTPDALMVLVNGMTMDRPTVAASLDGSPAWDSYEISEARRVDVGDGAAALVYRAEAVRDGEEPFVALMASTYRTVDGEPRLALYQQTTATH